MFVCFFRTFRHLLQPLLRPLSQHLILLLALLLAHRLSEQLVVQIHQIIWGSARTEHHPLQVLRACIHFQMQQHTDAHDVLKNSLAPLAPAHQMPTAAGRLLQHHQADLVLLSENHVPYLRTLGLIVTIHIVEEVAADALRPCYLAVYVPQVIGQLHQFPLVGVAALSGLRQMRQVLRRVPQRHQLLSVLNGTGHLPVPPAPVFSVSNLINHTYFLLLSLLLLSFKVTPS